MKPKNACAGPAGAVYTAYIERPALAHIVGRLIWGVDLRPLYASIEALAELRGPLTVVDVPCGSGLELRGLPRDQDLRVIALDIDDAMLERTRRRGAERGLAVETLKADMRELPLETASADVVLSYSGLHMIEGADAAVAECARVLRPGGRLVGTTFTSDGGRRLQAIFAAGARQGHAPLPGTGADLSDWLSAAGFVDVQVEGRGFATFSARKASGT